MVYTGAQIVKTDALRGIGEDIFSMHRLWEDAAAQGRFHGIAYPGTWCDVGHPEGIALAEDMLDRANA
jgi:N-acetyl-alpha-D-muramate 1-phosphate uridylyltransferase